MSQLPEKLVRIAATGSNPSTKTVLSTEQSSLLSNEDTPERNLLLTVATHALQMQAGYIPAQSPNDLPQPPEQNEKMPCSLKAQYHLMLMLNGLHDNLLPMWFEKLEEYQQAIPAEMIPTLLDYGARKRKLASHIREALGARGIWLAEQSQNKRWQWIILKAKKKREEHSRYTAWANHFQRLRQSDRQRALDTLIEHWDELDPLMRWSLVNEMAEDVQAEDIPFLWSCLDDDFTRDLAISLLLQIDELGLAKEVYDNIKNLIVLKQIEGEWVIDFAYKSTFRWQPEHINPLQARELCELVGYDFSPESILMMLPLSYWYETYNATPEILVSAASKSSRPEVFYRIWENRAIQEQDADFLYVLMLHVEHYATAELMRHLSQEQLMKLAANWLNQQPIYAVTHYANKILSAIKTPWDDDLTDVFLDSLETAFRKIPRPMLDRKMREELLRYAEWISLDAYSRFESILHINERGDLSEAEIEEINGILSIIKFRDEIMNALQTEIHTKLTTPDGCQYSERVDE